MAASERNLPVMTLPVAPGQYDQADQSQLRSALMRHWHASEATGGVGNVDATVLLPLDNGLDPLADTQSITAVVTFGYTVVGYRLIEDCGLSGDLVIKVLYATNAAFPTFTEISGTQRPTLAAGHAEERTALSGWTATAGDAYSQLRAVVVGNATNITRAVLALALQKV